MWFQAQLIRLLELDRIKSVLQQLEALRVVADMIQKSTVALLRPLAGQTGFPGLSPSRAEINQVPRLDFGHKESSRRRHEMFQDGQLMTPLPESGFPEVLALLLLDETFHSLDDRHALRLDTNMAGVQFYLLLASGRFGPLPFSGLGRFRLWLALVEPAQVFLAVTAWVCVALVGTFAVVANKDGDGRVEVEFYSGVGYEGAHSRPIGNSKSKKTVK